MPDNLNRTLTLRPNLTLTCSTSGPFMSLFTLSHTHTHTTYLSTLSLSQLINTFLSFCTHSISTSLSLSTHTPSLYHSTHPLSITTHTPSSSVSISKHPLPSLCTHFPYLSLSLYLLPLSLSLSLSLSLNTHTPPTIFTRTLYLSAHFLSLSTHTKSLLTQQLQSEAWDLICVYIIVHTLYIF